MSLISFSRDKFIPSDEVSLLVKDNYLGVVRGYQVFTFLKTVNNGIPVFLYDHIDRIFANAAEMNMKLSHSKDEVISLVLQTIQKNDFTESECNIMIIFSGTIPSDNSGLISDNPVDLFIITSKIKIYPKTSYENGISLGLFEYERIDGQIKSPFTYYGGMKAQQSLVKSGKFDEVIYTSNGQILEGTTFSFFGVKNDTVITPKSDGRILGSVTRKAILALMKEHNIMHTESTVRTEDIKDFSEAFIASANRDLIPVVSIDNIQIGDGKVNVKYHQLMDLYSKKIHNKN